MKTPEQLQWYREIELTCGAKALVDSDIYEIAKGKRWKINNYGYPKWLSFKDNKMLSVVLHKLVLDVPVGMHTDHKNGNKLDNRRSNLRVATPSQNGANQKIRIGGTSRYKGVYWKKESKKWCASIRVNKNRIHLGYYEIEDDAARVYDQAALLHFGEYALLNDALLTAIGES